MRRRAFTIIELLVVVFVFLAMFAALAPFVRMAKMRANRINCANNLRQISLGLHKYARDHQNKFPKTLGELYPGYITDGEIFNCPSIKFRSAKDTPDYIYTQDLTEASPGREVIVLDTDGNHKRSGRNVLRVDGTVEWVK
ncbi:MAG: type II secretion system protein [Candidatus Omnitrophica bacterium]|nr:type II secretion system protein [Candidatus Omnitrophota bacterium]